MGKSRNILLSVLVILHNRNTFRLNFSIYFSFVQSPSYTVGDELDGDWGLQGWKEVSIVKVLESVEDGDRVVSEGEDVVLGDM